MDGRGGGELRTLRAGRPQRTVCDVGAALPLLDEARLVLVGRGGAGKTSIVDRLVHDRFAPGRAQTDGVEIETWQVAAHGRTIRVNVWDFAGQADTHASHQPFISPGSVNVLVLAGGEDTLRRGDYIQRRDAEYWLQLLQAFGTDPTGGLGPVIVVLNQVDRYPLELDRAALAERYPAIVAFVETDCATGRGIATLRGVVEQALAGLPGARRVVPVALRLVRDALEAELTKAPRLPVPRRARGLAAAPDSTHRTAERRPAALGQRRGDATRRCAGIGTARRTRPPHRCGGARAAEGTQGAAGHRAGNLQTMHADLPGLEVVESIEVVPRAFTPVETLESDARDARPSGVPTPEGTVMVDAAGQLDRLSQPAPCPAERRRARVFVS